MHLTHNEMLVVDALSHADGRTLSHDEIESQLQPAGVEAPDLLRTTGSLVTHGLVERLEGALRLSDDEN